MMKFNSCFLVFLLLSSFLASGQGVKAVADYEQTFRMGSGFGGRQLSDEQRERMADRMRSMEPREYRLTITGDLSGYEFSGKVSEGRSGFSGSFFRDAGSMTTVNRVAMRDSVFLVRDTLREIPWELHEEETMEIGPLLVYKATAALPREGAGGFAMGADRGQRAEMMEVVAWYCPEIKSNHGPGRYWGLPGLILEVEEPNAIISCVNIELFPPGLQSVVFPAEGIALSPAEFSEKMRSVWEERRRARSQRN